MKRSFLIKQLKSLHAQVESLLEAEGLVPVDAITGGADSPLGKMIGFVPSEAPKTFTAAALYVKDAADPKKIFGPKSAMAELTGTAPNTPPKSEPVPGIIEHIRKYFNDLLKTIDGWMDSAKEAIKSKPWLAPLVNAYRALRDGAKKFYDVVKSEASKFWTNMATWQKVCFVLGIMVLLGVIVMMAVNNPEVALEYAAKALTDSVKSSGKKISDAISNLTSKGVLEGIKLAAMAIFEIVMAPLKALFAVLTSEGTKAFVPAIGASLVLFGTSACLLFYKANIPTA